MCSEKKKQQRKCFLPKEKKSAGSISENGTWGLSVPWEAGFLNSKEEAQNPHVPGTKLPHTHTTRLLSRSDLEVLRQTV